MKLQKIGLLLVSAFALATMTGCAHKPDLHDITPSQTAFLVPTIGNTKNQSKFTSTDFLKNQEVAGKRVVVTYSKQKWGVGPNQFNWVPDNYLYLVDRMAVSREWTKEAGLRAESSDSIGFTAQANVVAEIQEKDAYLYLYYYGASGALDEKGQRVGNQFVFNARSLENVLDKEIRSRVSGLFTELSARNEMKGLVKQKAAMMENIRSQVLPYFKKRGITITALALTGDFIYDEKEIQDAFNSQFVTSQQAEAQANASTRALEKARNDVKVANLIAKSRDILVLRRLENDRYRLETERIRWQRWTGQEAPRIGYYSPGSLVAPEAAPAPPVNAAPAVANEQPSETQ